MLSNEAGVSDHEDEEGESEYPWPAEDLFDYVTDGYVIDELPTTEEMRRDPFG